MKMPSSKTAAFARPVKARWILYAATAFFLIGAVDVCHAYRLTNRDLRAFGYAGIYRGFSRGSAQTWNGDYFDTGYIDQRTVERLPTRRRSVVTGPTGNNGFFLLHRAPTGNSRRIKIRSYYSGISYNGFYDEDMVGSGSKTITVTRRDFSRPQFEMKVVDRLNERSAYDGVLFSNWRIRAYLSKG